MSLLNKISKPVAKKISSFFTEDASEKEIKDTINKVINKIEEAPSTSPKKELFAKIADEENVTLDFVKQANKINNYRSGGGKSDSLLGEVASTVRAMVKEPTSGQKYSESLGGTKTTREARRGKGFAILGTAVVTIPSTAYISSWQSNKDNKGKPPSDFEKAFSKAHNAGQETFMFKGKEYTTEVRKGKAMGSKVITKNIIDFAEKLLAKELPEKAAKRRAAIKSEAEAEDIIVNEINSNPYALDEMPLSILENLSVKNKAKIGLADEYSAGISESTSGMLKGMPPKEAAENLLAFDDDDIFDYMSTLNAKDLREFKDNLSEDDFEVFGGYMPELGPREKKAEGSLLGPMEGKEKEAVKAIIINKLNDIQDPRSKSLPDSLLYLQEADPSIVMSAIGQTVSPEDQRKIREKIFGRMPEANGGSLLLPEEMPVDTYTPEEQKNAEENMIPDGEMEDNYMDYVLGESLETEEQDYLMTALESDPKLSEIFDKVLMTASEFSGAGEVEGPGTGVSDSIPARLSDGEFVITKKATDQIGADNLQKMMDDAERMADGGLARNGYQFGGMLQDPQKELEAMSQLRSTDEEVNQAMLRSNQVPSLRRY